MSESPKKLKVLFLGHCSFFHVQNLAELMKSFDKDMQIAVANPVKPDGSKVDEKEAVHFDEVISLPRKRLMNVSANEMLAEILPAMKQREGRHRLVRDLIALDKKRAGKYLRSAAEEKKFDKEIRNQFAEYDVFHFHFIGPASLAPLKYIGKDKVIIMHVWGSDLLNTAGVENYRIQYSGLTRADFIITNTLELSQYLLAKFGREFSAKLRNAFFVINNRTLRSIASADRDATRTNFLEKFGIDKDKIIVEVGYNASPWQKHREILSEMSKLPADIRQRIHLLIPLTYGIDPRINGYTGDVRSYAESTGIGYTAFEKYLSSDIMRELALSVDIKLNLRETDNLNTSMVESLCAGAVVVNGSWMPYGTLRRYGIYYRELDSIEQLSGEMKYLIDNLNIEKEKAGNNPSLVLKFFDNKKIAVSWKKLYDEVRALSNSRRRVHAAS